MLKFIKRLCMTILIGLALYALLGFLILPKVALYAVNQQLLPAYATQPAQLKNIVLDPFRLQLKLQGFSLGQAEKSPELAFEEFSVRLLWSSLWEKRLHLESVELIQPSIQVKQAKNGTLNLAQWFKIPASEPDEKQSAPLPPVWVDSVRIQKGQWQYQDAALKETLSIGYNELALEIANLSTEAKSLADLTLSMGTDTQGITLQAKLGVNPVSLQGHLKLKGLEAQKIRPYLTQSTPLRLTKGQLALSTDFHLNLEKSLQLQLSQLQLAVKNLAIQAPDKRALLQLASLEISKSSVDLAKRQVRIGQIDSTRLETWATREKDGQIDWQKLFAEPSTAPSKKTSNTSSKNTAPSSAKKTNTETWQVRLDDVDLSDYQIHLTDRQPNEAVNLDVGPLNLSLNDFDTQGQSPIRFKLSTGLGAYGKLKTQGQLDLNTWRGQLSLNTQDLNLRLAQAYLDPFVRIELRSGLLNTDLNLELKDIEPLAFRVTGKAELSQLHTLETAKKRDLLKWNRLSISSLDYLHGERLKIGRVDLVQPYTRFIINPDLTTNISDLMVQQKATDTGSSAQKSSTTNSSKPLGIQIDGIRLINGSAYFADLSLNPDFATGIQSLNGEIGRIDNNSKQPAPVVLKGKVNSFSPVDIKGNLALFDPLQNLDIRTQFQRLEMTTLTPYSGKFAGYRIRKGRMDLDLHYQIQKRQLKAENKILIHQLQLGEQVDSTTAADIPVRLAVALLKDSDGVISLDIPLEGNLDDPKFSVMPLLGQTLGNLLSKAVQAPFRMLGGLVNLVGGEGGELGKVPFAPGSATLTPESQANLSKLAAALKERPSLALEVEGSIDPKLDGPLLAEDYLDNALKELWYKMLQRRGGRVPSNANQLELSPREKTQMLEVFYQEYLAQATPKEWGYWDAQTRIKNTQQALVNYWQTNPDTLRKLAQDRASAVKQYLVRQEHIDNTRIYILDSNTKAEGQQGVISTPLYLAGQ